MGVLEEPEDVKLPPKKETTTDLFTEIPENFDSRE
jgi:hypothetical protein